MTKLSDTQRVLLSTASQRADGNLLPLPTTVRPGGGTAKAMVALLKHGFAEERHSSGAAGDGNADAPYGVFMTAAGALAIGVEMPGQGARAVEAEELPDTPAAPTAKALTKAATVLALLERADGATLPELIEATGWLPHTTRAALTGIRKKGHVVTKSKREGETCYRIGGGAA